MTDPPATGLRSPAGAAEAAAGAAGVRIRPLTGLDEFDQVYRLYQAIWHPDPTNPPVTGELLRALTKAGNYVAGAYADGELVGAGVGFFGAPAHRELHSHIAGVSAAARGRNVGFALKLHQRAWALDRGVAAITWTYDPLIARNAYFNVVKLGAEPVEYLPNFYGGMLDGINAGDETDRLLVRWDLTAPHVEDAAAGRIRRVDAAALRAAGAVVGLDRAGDGTPVAGSPDGGTVLVAVPPDVGALRGTDPGLARRWRIAVRDVVRPLLTGGGRITGFDRTGWYVVTRERTEA
ncbi:GNAT family N-acetyltransferase [Jidongwangia harbinensis]|uniref:GNAT family N-acetyltransferase n=1 Tax=Jidongwangia harbinensis TaxID=2878561 RepID=UPI001CD9E128|nr:GNAT family N-acetyltransferase [Jidongwangia harbinensis]MCA2214221.1 GNAT family N-acetyltransferase [Jidongwangia harbinensis]